MTSPVFALCVACFFMWTMAQATEKFSSSALQESTFISAQTGDNLTLHCFHDVNDYLWIYWYKHNQAQKPKLISRYYKNVGITFYDEFKNNPRFNLDVKNSGSHLKITNLQTSDSATYYCMSWNTYKIELLTAMTVSVKGSRLNVPVLVHQSTSEIVQPGGSVTLNCTVHTGACDGEHSVYWFRHSGESQPGLIYTHGGRNDQCERNNNTPTHTCVYDLLMTNLNVSHAGTYYCAVASCGHILFGDGTKLDLTVDENGEGNSLMLVQFLGGALTFTTILVVLLSVSVYKMKKTIISQTLESGATFSASSATNTQGYQEGGDLHYAALSVSMSNRGRRQKDGAKNECVYSSVKL